MNKNIFEFLDLPADHRTGNKVTQHVKHIDEVPASKKAYPMLGQIKKDGVYAMVVRLPNYETAIFSRTGKMFTNTKELIHQIDFYSLASMPDKVYIAELCNDFCSLETLSGMINPNRIKPLSRNQDNLLTSNYLSYHDAIPIDDFIKGSCKITYNDRYDWLFNKLPKEFDILSIYEVRDAMKGDRLFKSMVKIGEEGAVFKQDLGWVAGHKGFRMMKKVRGVDYDLLCVGWEEGKGKYKGLVTNLIFEWKNGKEIKCMLGKGWTHEDARGMYQTIKHIEAGLCDTSLNGSPVGKIFQVYALQESSKGKLRIPKVGELRFDKDEPDL